MDRSSELRSDARTARHHEPIGIAIGPGLTPASETGRIC